MTDAFTAWTLAALAGGVAGLSNDDTMGWCAAVAFLLAALAFGMSAVAGFDREGE